MKRMILGICLSLLAMPAVAGTADCQPVFQVNDMSWTLPCDCAEATGQSAGMTGETQMCYQAKFSISPDERQHVDAPGAPDKPEHKCEGYEGPPKP